MPDFWRPPQEEYPKYEDLEWMDIKLLDAKWLADYIYSFQMKLRHILAQTEKQLTFEERLSRLRELLSHSNDYYAKKAEKMLKEMAMN